MNLFNHLYMYKVHLYTQMYTESVLHRKCAQPSWTVAPTARCSGEADQKGTQADSMHWLHMHALGAWCMRASGGQCPALRARPFRRRPLSDSSRTGRPLTSELEFVLWLKAQDLLHLRHGPPRRGWRRGRGAAAWVAGHRGGGRGRGAGRVHGTHVRTHARPDARTHVRTRVAAAGLRQRPEAPAAKGDCTCARLSGPLRRHGLAGSAEGGASAAGGVVSQGLGGGAVSCENVQ